MESGANGRRERVTTDGDQHFFGYHDLCPWSIDERYVLSHTLPAGADPPSGTGSLGICVHDLERGTRDVVAETAAWNYQLGSRLQWRGSSHPHHLVFNAVNNDRLVSRIVDVDGREIDEVSAPIYTTAPSGDWGVTLSFERLHELRRGYGYPAVDGGGSIDSVPNDDGLYLVDLTRDELDLAISIDSLADRSGSGDVVAHWVNHLTIAPDGNRIGFLHRWTLPDGGMYTRLLTASNEGDDLECVVDGGKVTHYTWRSPEQIVAWSRRPGVIGESAKRGVFGWPGVRQAVDAIRRVSVPRMVRQRVIGDGYHLFDIETGEGEGIGTGVLDRDGHPSVRRDGRWMVTDTYPDRSDRRMLLLFDLEERTMIELDAFESPPEVDGTSKRCDLHPRWNRSGSEVCIDSMHDGSRQMYVVDVSPHVW